jgi:hypothetical protein
MEWREKLAIYRSRESQGHPAGLDQRTERGKTSVKGVEVEPPYRRLLEYPWFTVPRNVCASTPEPVSPAAFMIDLNADVLMLSRSIWRWVRLLTALPPERHLKVHLKVRLTTKNPELFTECTTPSYPLLNPMEGIIKCTAKFCSVSRAIGCIETMSQNCSGDHPTLSSLACNIEMQYLSRKLARGWTQQTFHPDGVLQNALWLKRMSFFPTLPTAPRPQWVLSTAGTTPKGTKVTLKRCIP